MTSLGVWARWCGLGRTGGLLWDKRVNQAEEGLLWEARRGGTQKVSRAQAKAKSRSLTAVRKRRDRVRDDKFGCAGSVTRDAG